MKTKHISVVLAVFNEEKNLGRCLESARPFADEIIVVDGKSTDNTVSVAKQYGAKIISASNKPNFHINKNIAIDAAAGDWVLQLDADEPVPPELAEEIVRVTREKSDYNGYWIPRKNYFLGRFLLKGGQYPDYTLRLYRNGFGRLPAQSVHEQAVVRGKVGYLNNPLLHYGTPDFENYLLRFNRYTSLTADHLKSTHLNINIFNAARYLVIKPLSTFINIYFRHKGFTDGFPGFIFALYSGLHHAVAYIKFWQIKKYPA
jgi:glycosyltransferase involved in cell wall biosynthesis